MLSFFFFNDTATTEIYTLSLHDALPISNAGVNAGANGRIAKEFKPARTGQVGPKLHPTLDSPWVTETRIYEGGCAMSTATGALGALSFPTRSTAVTVYQ